MANEAAEQNDDALEDFIDSVFGEGGYLAQHFEGYEPRDGQVEMASACAEAMEGGRNLIVEAPTGVGKSIAYGVSATARASQGEKVAIVTANIALQEQLVNKDLPLLKEVLPWDFTFALAKGLGNYLCKAEFNDNTDGVLMGTSDLTPRELEQWNEVSKWAATSKTGDLSELTFEPSFKMRKRFTTTSDECTGKKCPYFDECSAMQARKQTREAQVVVTNYALFFIDLVIKCAGGDGLLPKYQHVILDEGHKAADLAREHAGFRVSRGGIVHMTRLLDRKQGPEAKNGPLPELDAELRRKIGLQADSLFSSLLGLYKSREYRVRFRRNVSNSVAQDVVQMVELLQQASKVLSTASRNEPGLTEQRRHELQSHSNKCAEYAGQLNILVDEMETDWVYFLEPSGDGVAFKGKPVSVSEWLRTNLFEKKEGDFAIKSVIVTSATLSSSSGFGYISRQLGLKNAEELQVESPFDLKNNMEVVIPRMPEPNSEQFVEAACDAVKHAIEYARGRTLCLFTSYRVMNEVYESIRPTSGEVLPYTILKQGDAPRSLLVQQFKEDETSVLLGTESFWAGVDVPGPALSCVVIDRIPFPNLGDPLQDVLKEKCGKRYFFDISIPAAAIMLKQGVGRLIRSLTDRGVVVLLDSRVVEKGYGRSFMKMFPSGVTVKRKLAAIGEFLYGD